MAASLTRIPYTATSTKSSPLSGRKLFGGKRSARSAIITARYDAHLHFELRKNVNVGMYRSSFPRDLSVYWVPSDFIASHRALATGDQYAAVPVNTFAAQPPPVLSGPRESTPFVTFGRANTFSPPAAGTTPTRRAQTFTIDRYGDIREYRSP